VRKTVYVVQIVETALKEELIVILMGVQTAGLVYVLFVLYGNGVPMLE